MPRVGRLLLRVMSLWTPTVRRWVLVLATLAALPLGVLLGFKSCEHDQLRTVAVGQSKDEVFDALVADPIVDGVGVDVEHTIIRPRTIDDLPALLDSEGIYLVARKPRENSFGVRIVFEGDLITNVAYSYWAERSGWSDTLGFAVGQSRETALERIRDAFMTYGTSYEMHATNIIVGRRYVSFTEIADADREYLFRYDIWEYRLDVNEETWFFDQVDHNVDLYFDENRLSIIRALTVIPK